MSEQESNIDNIEEVEKLPEEIPIKIKKPLSSERLEQLKISENKSTRKET